MSNSSSFSLKIMGKFINSSTSTQTYYVRSTGICNLIEIYIKLWWGLSWTPNVELIKDSNQLWYLWLVTIIFNLEMEGEIFQNTAALSVSLPLILSLTWQINHRSQKKWFLKFQWKWILYLNIPHNGNQITKCIVLVFTTF